MNKIKIITLSIFLTIFAAPTYAMENAPDAVNDTRTVPVITAGPWKVCTGFLYSSRIVLTAGHCLHDINTQGPHGQQYVGLPGKPYSKDAFKVPVEKTLVPAGWSFKGSDDMTDRNDFGILILRDPIEITGKTTIATEQQIAKYLENKTLISTIGYGRQSASHDHNDFTIPKYAEFPLASFSEVEQELQNAWSYYGSKKYWGMKIHLLQVPNGPSTCGGDSGSPFYVKDGNDFIYLGPLSWGIGGMPACSGSGWRGSKMYMGSVAAYDYIDLIKQAEEYVGIKNVLTEPIVVNNTEKVKTTIKCYKGKSIKKIYGFSPKCPKGYKLKV
jgi:secreted trypsin-like serine protease